MGVLTAGRDTHMHLTEGGFQHVHGFFASSAYPEVTQEILLGIYPVLPHDLQDIESKTTRNPLGNTYKVILKPITSY